MFWATERAAETAALDARRRVIAAEQDYDNAIRRAFPVGRSITYAHGENRVRCEVVDHLSHGYLLVRGKSGKQYRIDGWRALPIDIRPLPK